MRSTLFKNAFCVTALTLGAGTSFAEMKALDDELLSGVSGQSGITLDLAANIKTDEIAYFDDGNGIALQGVRLVSAADPDEFAEFRFDIDILADGALALDFESKNVSRFEFDDVRFVDTPGLTPNVSDASMGGVFLDFYLDGYAELRGGGAVSTDGFTLDASWAITNGKFGYRTNGNEILLDGLTWNVNTPGTTLDVDDVNGILDFRTPNLTAELLVDAIRYSNNPLNHAVSNDVTSGNPLASYGSFWANLSLDSALQLQAQGRSGSEGLRLDSQTTINRLDLAWGDDTDFASTGYWLGIIGLNGTLDIENLTIDVLEDPDSISDPAKDFGLGLALAFDRLEANLTVADLVLGETKQNIDDSIAGTSSLVNSVGGVALNLLLADAVYNGNSYTNSIILQAGGNTDAGNQGLRLDTQISIASPNNESNFTYFDDNYGVMISGIEGFVDGDITLDVTSAGTIGSTEFFDGLRLGFEDLEFGLQSEGLRVGENTGDANDLKNEELQSSTGFRGLFGQAVYPLMEGTLNGHITIGPGGSVGTEGLTVNSDLELSEGTFATYLQEDGRGIWLSGLNYDTHLRDMTLDVTSSGLQIIKGEAWSKLDISDFSVGERTTAESFGRLVIETYEANSETLVSAGGAGTVCVGGTGVTESACDADGGYWSDRGTQGLTIATKRFFQDAVESEGKRNRITWETSRVGEGTANPTNDSGLKLVFDNFSTNDGDGINDTYGFNVDYKMDVARTRVLKKSDGLDNNGVSGQKGYEKIYNADGTYRYVAPGSVTAADRANRPIGIAMQTRTHFKEFDIESVKLSHPTGGESTLLYGLKIQNLDMTTDITATPLN